MNMHDRLRSELRDRAADIPISGAGPDAVIDTARARLRRTRVAGATVALAMVVGVTGAALALRDGDEQVVTDEAAAAETQADPLPDDTLAPPTDEPETEAGEEPAADTPPEEGEDEAVSNTEDAGEEDDDGSAIDDDAEDSETETDDGAGDGTSSEGSENDPPGVSSPVAQDLVAHNGGFVARRGGSALWYSDNGVSWSAIASPSPNDAFTEIVSYNGALYAAGTASTGAGPTPWVMRSDDMASWVPVEVPQPGDDGSALTTLFNTITSLAVGPAGVIVTGETIVHINVEEILSDDVLAADAYTLGDSTGDRTKIVIYDTETGDPVEEINLGDLDIPQSTLDLYADPSPIAFTAIGESSLTELDTDLAGGTVLRSTIVNGNEYIAAGFSATYSSQIVWTSTDGTSWEEVPVSVIGKAGADVIGRLGDRIAVFSSQGPLFTVQLRQGGSWNEIRLHEQFGSRNDRYTLLDASFGGGGVAAAVATTDGAGNETVYVLTSTDGVSWNIAELTDVAASASAVTTVHSVAVSGSRVAVSYDRAGGTSESAVLPLTLN